MKQTLSATLPNGTIVTRTTEHEYQFVVYFEFDDGSYNVKLWTTRPDLRDKEIAKLTPHVGTYGIKSVGYANVVTVAPKSNKRAPRQSATVWIFTRAALLEGLNARELWEAREKGLPNPAFPFAFNPVEIRIHPDDVAATVAKWENSAAMVGRVFVRYSEMPSGETYNEVYGLKPSRFDNQDTGQDVVSWWVD